MPFSPKSFNSASICSHVIDSFTMMHPKKLLRRAHLLLFKLYSLHGDGYLTPECGFVVDVDVDESELAGP